MNNAKLSIFDFIKYKKYYQSYSLKEYEELINKLADLFYDNDEYSISYNEFRGFPYILYPDTELNRERNSLQKTEYYKINDFILIKIIKDNTFKRNGKSYFLKESEFKRLIELSEKVEERQNDFLKETTIDYMWYLIRKNYNYIYMMKK